MARTEHLVTCPLCEAMCGLRVEVDSGRVARVRPNKSDVVLLDKSGLVKHQSFTIQCGLVIHNDELGASRDLPLRVTVSGRKTPKRVARCVVPKAGRR